MSDKEKKEIEIEESEITFDGEGGASGVGGDIHTHTHTQTHTHTHTHSHRQTVNLSYTDNYSTLRLVYTFLLNLVNGSGKNAGEEMKTEIDLLLTVLRETMEEQKKHHEAFLQAVKSLNQEPMKE